MSEVLAPHTQTNTDLVDADFHTRDPRVNKILQFTELMNTTLAVRDENVEAQIRQSFHNTMSREQTSKIIAQEDILRDICQQTGIDFSQVQNEIERRAYDLTITDNYNAEITKLVDVERKIQQLFIQMRTLIRSIHETYPQIPADMMYEKIDRNLCKFIEGEGESCALPNPPPTN